jgi:hypothetical protein
MPGLALYGERRLEFEFVAEILDRRRRRVRR